MIRCAMTITYCPLCRYWLQGLPAEGRCPECGNPYGPDQFVLQARTGSPNRRRAGRTVSMAAYLVAGAAMFVMAGFFSRAGVRGIAILPFAAGIVFFALAFAAKRWGIGTGVGPAVLVYLAPHGYGQGSPRRGINTFYQWTRGLEIDFRFAQNTWWLSIRDGMLQHVLAQLDVDEATVRTLRDALQSWQSARVCIEK
jgi:hypothetical protein